jgi:GNAT superfamily N-acetyltransferase
VSATIASYDPADAPALIALWNRALGYRFPMSARLWRENVGGDPNWRPGDGLVLRLADGTIAGFALTRRFRQLDRYPTMAPVRDLGWIMALAIAPEHAGRGHGSQLLAAAEQHLRGQGASQCDLGGSPGHFLPGPPADDERALRFWQRHRYEPATLVHDLHRSLADWQPRPLDLPGGWRCAAGQPGQEADLLAFLDTSFPGRWHYHLADSLARGARIEDVALLLAPDGAVSGFAATWHAASPLLGPATNWHPALGPHFGGLGPLGIAASARGHGRGLALVAAAATLLHRRGVVECAIDWATLLDFYARLGFTPWRSYWRCAPKAL